MAITWYMLSGATYSWETNIYNFIFKFYRRILKLSLYYCNSTLKTSRYSKKILKTPFNEIKWVPVKKNLRFQVWKNVHLHRPWLDNGFWAHECTHAGLTLPSMKRRVTFRNTSTTNDTFRISHYFPLVVQRWDEILCALHARPEIPCQLDEVTEIWAEQHTYTRELCRVYANTEGEGLRRTYPYLTTYLSMKKGLNWNFWFELVKRGKTTFPTPTRTQ